MNEKNTWLSRSAGVLSDLRMIVRTSGPDTLVGRKDVERIFGLKRRSAQILMEKAGAIPGEGGHFLEADHLIRYVHARGGKEAAMTEKQRQRRMWTILDQARKEVAGKTRVFYDKDQKILRPVEETRSKGLDGLPEGVEIRRGFIGVSFQEPAEAVMKLYQLAQALMGDYQRFEEKAVPMR